MRNLNTALSYGDSEVGDSEVGDSEVGDSEVGDSEVGLYKKLQVEFDKMRVNGACAIQFIMGWPPPSLGDASSLPKSRPRNVPTCSSSLTACLTCPIASYIFARSYCDPNRNE